MDKIFQTMMIGIVFTVAAEALRNPEKYSQHERDMMAQSLEKFGDSIKTSLTGDLMKDAVKEVPQGN